MHATHKAARASGGRPVPAHNLHVTLLFIGSVAESRIPEIEATAVRATAAANSGGSTASAPTGVAARMGGVGGTAGSAGTRADASAGGRAGAPPMLQLVFDRIEFWEKARVLVATTGEQGDAGQAVVGALAGRLQREASRAGFTPDLKPFRAHVTVARKVARLTHSLQMHEIRWPVTNFALVESRTLPEGSLYSVINSWGLDTRRNN